MAAPPHTNPHQRTTQAPVHGPEDKAAGRKWKVARSTVQDFPYAFFALPGHLAFDAFHKEIEHLRHNKHCRGASVLHEPGKPLWLAARRISDARSVPQWQKQPPCLLVDVA